MTSHDASAIFYFVNARLVPTVPTQVLPPPVTPDDRVSVGLTFQERDVLAISATGRAVQEVAEVLGLSPEIVRQHIVSAISKLGTRSKLEAVVLALRHGLIEPPA